MKAIEQLVTVSNIEFTSKVMEEPISEVPRTMRALPVARNLYLSIQASATHHSLPKQTLTDLTKYRAMEIALVTPKGRTVRIDKVIPNFPRLAELEYHDENVFYSEVPVDLIEDIYQELCKEDNK